MQIFSTVIRSFFFPWKLNLEIYLIVSVNFWTCWELQQLCFTEESPASFLKRKGWDLRLSITPWIHPGHRHQRTKKRMSTTTMTATRTPMAHHCLRPDRDRHDFSHVMLKLRSFIYVSCPLTAGHVRHLFQLLQYRVHAGGCLLHLLSKVPQHTERQQHHF